MISIFTMLWILWTGIVGFGGLLMLLWFLVQHIRETCKKVEPPVDVPMDWDAELRRQAEAREKSHIFNLKGGSSGIAIVSDYKRQLWYDEMKLKDPDFAWPFLRPQMDGHERSIAQGIVEMQKQNGVYTEGED